jgi:hypothetical protein
MGKMARHQNPTPFTVMYFEKYPSSFPGIKNR